MPSFDSIPIGAVLALTLLFAFAAIASGVWLGAQNADRTAAQSIGAVAGATLGLVAFMLALTFNMTASRYDARKQLLLDDVNAIETTYLRAGLLPAPYAEEARTLLREYVEVRAGTARGGIDIGTATAASAEIHDGLWLLVERLNAEQPLTPAQNLFVQALNALIDVHTGRLVLALDFRIPGSVWLGLYLVAGLGMAVVGYQFGRWSRPRIVVATLLVTAFSTVIIMIADLDRTTEGLTSLNQKPMFDLEARLVQSP